MKKLLGLVFLILSVTILVKPLSIYSQTSSSQDYRLEQIEKLSATAGAKVATNSAKLSSAGLTFITGYVTSVSGSLIFLDTEKGTKTIYTSDTTKYYNFDTSGKKLIGIGDLKAGDIVDVIGLSTQSNSGSAKIVVREQTKPIKNFGLIGKVSEINSTTLKLSNVNRTDLPLLQTTINSETTISNASKQNLKLTDITINNLVVVAGFLDDKNNLIDKTVFKISTASSKTATSSAK